MTQTFADTGNAFMGIFENALSKQDAIVAYCSCQGVQGSSDLMSQEPSCGYSTVSQPPSPEQTTEDPPIRRRGRRKKDDGSFISYNNSTDYFSCIFDTRLIAQVWAIAWQEHMTVRAVVESMFSKCIAKYEKKRGPIQIEPNQSSEELFWLSYFLSCRADTELNAGSVSAHFV